MKIGEWLAWMALLLLALYGCAQLIRRVCLWFTLIPRSVRCCRVAVPEGKEAIEPLLRCMQAQAAWNKEEMLLVLPPLSGEEQTVVRRAAAETPAVTPVLPAELTARLLPPEWTAAPAEAAE